MKFFYVVMALLLMSTEVMAVDDGHRSENNVKKYDGTNWSYGSEPQKNVKEYDGAQWSSNHEEVKEALVRVLIYKNWKIQSHERHSISATYKSKCSILIEIVKQKIKIQEVLNDRCIFNPSWLDFIGTNYLRNLELNYHLRLIKEQEQTDV